ncbi:Dps DNA-binding ferritin-like protein (oxidative damage protectant) [uncultured Caudovirales phage]|uniref:Dps DNA-binding ferritin-like protein (Oxidative damage protectant) n=1 Tax=uncultured Caudovirales phage TaxID=2100421 RepID=A0A6J5P277_9CAUD|nr:Dps DNA-binding ferritin-like protein (oxidative damage protectant) [uncultured Caudovirales phage]
MTTQLQLEQVFNDNFVAYFRSHVAHVNIMGRNFHSDHELLGGIYEELQGQIDTIAELLRSLGEFMPDSVGRVLEGAKIIDDSVEGDSDTLLALVRADLEELKGSYEELIAVADSEGYLEIANYAQDRVLSLAKHIWMLDSTLA